MYVIEPCCVARQLRMLRDSIGNNGSKQFEGYGDLSLAELLPAMLTRYGETRMLIAAPSVPDQAAEIISKWMGRQWARADGSGKMDVVSHLTVIADLSAEKSPVAHGWLEDNPFGDRLSLVDRAQEDTAILLPDFAVTGPVNMRYGRRFTATATTVPGDVVALWTRFGAMASDGKPAEDGRDSREEEGKDAGDAQEHAQEPPSETKGEEGARRGRAVARRGRSKDRAAASSDRP